MPYSKRSFKRRTKNMKKVMAIIFFANIVLVVAMLSVLPKTVAVHFVSGGQPDSWMPRNGFTLFLLAIELPLFLFFLAAPALFTKTSLRWTNIPNKNYWKKEENKGRMKNKLTSLMAEFGCALFLLFFLITLLTIAANLAEPVRLEEKYALSVIIIFMIYIIYWALKFILSFRLPKDKFRRHKA